LLILAGHETGEARPKFLLVFLQNGRTNSSTRKNRIGGWRIGIVMRGNFYAKTPRTGPKRNAADASIFVLAIFGASDFADELLGQGLRLATVLGLISAGGARLQVKR
jgi:hypothetical protein